MSSEGENSPALKGGTLTFKEHVIPLLFKLLRNTEKQFLLLYMGLTTSEKKTTEKKPGGKYLLGM